MSSAVEFNNFGGASSVINKFNIYALINANYNNIYIGYDDDNVPIHNIITDSDGAIGALYFIRDIIRKSCTEQY